MKPTTVRYRVLAFCIALGAVTYMDRVCISLTSRDISRDLGLDDVQMGFVFSAFTLAYAAFEIPTGWWGDRVGTRSVLTRIVTWWSSFTILTAASFNYPSLLALRFLFGAGEAGAWPNVARTFSRWFPLAERARAQGIFFTGAHGGATITPILITFMLGYMNWRWIFVIFGSIGFLWAIAWWKWFHDEPSQHPAVNRAELDEIERGRVESGSHSLHGVPWRAILSDRNVLLLCASYLTQSYGFYFFITWLPTYLARERGFTAMSLGIYSALPMLASVVADIYGGVSADWASRRFGVRAGRAAAAATSFLCASLFMFFGTGARDPKSAAILLALACGWAAFCLGPQWGTLLDISGPHAGVVGACMNTAGQIGGFLCPIIIGYVVREFGNWSYPLYLTAGLFSLGAVCWLFIDPRKPIRLHHA